jgi:hypothetical protein
MSMIPKCVVCDRPVANPYAPDCLCERCKQPCPTCSGDVAYCRHPLPQLTETHGDPLLEPKRDAA